MASGVCILMFIITSLFSQEQPFHQMQYVYGIWNMEFSKVSSWCLDVGLVHCFWNGNSLGPSVLGPVTKHVFCLRACLSLDVSHHRKMSWKKKMQ